MAWVEYVTNLLAPHAIRTMPMRTQLVHSHLRRHPERKEACLLAGVCRLAPVACLLAGVCRPYLHPWGLSPHGSLQASSMVVRELAMPHQTGGYGRHETPVACLLAGVCRLHPHWRHLSPHGSLQGSATVGRALVMSFVIGHLAQRPAVVPRFLRPAPAGPGCLTCD